MPIHCHRRSTAVAISVLALRALVLLAVALLSACDRPPAHVYVLEAPQQIDLLASASVHTAKVGAPVVLHARRKTQGSWRRIPSAELKADQCWMAALPPSEEDEVAANVHWRAEPAVGARFSLDFRPDGTREVTFSTPGVYTLVASTAAWCEPGRQVPAAPVQVTVEGP